MAHHTAARLNGQPAESPGGAAITGARDDDTVSFEALNTYDQYFPHGQRCGPLTEPAASDKYKVRYRKVGSIWSRAFTKTIMMILIISVCTFAYFTVHPRFRGLPNYRNVHGQWPDKVGRWVAISFGAGWRWITQLFTASNFTPLSGATWYRVMEVGADICILCLIIFIVLNVITLAFSVNGIRYPIPVEPPKGLKVAFITTIVPKDEPIELARKTLKAAMNMIKAYRKRYGGLLEVWILDEGDDDQVKALCRELGARHFSRLNKGNLKFTSGSFARKTKHGNLNMWADEFADLYDVVCGVDLDHVPFMWYLERMLGYFRDPDVGYVCAPQFYANRRTIIERMVESAQFVFHSLLQNAGNSHNCTMLVGTCYAIRLKPLLEQLKGWGPCITEDFKTALDFMCTRNPDTGRHWKAVHVPEAVALGIGPANFTELFQQQGRWAGGTFQTLREQRLLLKVMFKMRPLAFLHYARMTTYYPSVALGWIMGMYVTVCYLALGMNPMHTNAQWWRAGYLDLAALQLILYWFARRFNVSPFEDKHHPGLSGMFMSALMAPVFAQAFFSKFVLGRNTKFNVTPKHGGDGNTDRLSTFRISLYWIPVPAISLAIGILEHRAYLLMVMWACIEILVCLAPLMLWQYERLQSVVQNRWGRRDIDTPLPTSTPESG